MTVAHRTITIWTCDRPGCGAEQEGDRFAPANWSKTSLTLTDKPHGSSVEIAKRSMDGNAHPVLLCPSCTEHLTAWWRKDEVPPEVECEAPQ